MITLTQEQQEEMELQTFLNQEAQKEKSANSSFSTVTDVNYWIARDVFNIEQYKHCMAQSTHYDLYQEAHNIKPRWIDYSELTTQEIELMIEDLVLQEAKQAQREAELKEKNKYRPNNVFSSIKSLIKDAN